jgi:hypothetical protein
MKPQQYASDILINLDEKSVQVSLKDKEATWVPQIILFDAVSNEAVFNFLQLVNLAAMLTHTFLWIRIQSKKLYSSSDVLS